jgi:cell division septum initiation protein DivIVA
MESSEVDDLVRQLASGFEALQEEYQKLFGQYHSLERKLATAREQVSAYSFLQCVCVLSVLL